MDYSLSGPTGGTRDGAVVWAKPSEERTFSCVLNLLLLTHTPEVGDVWCVWGRVVYGVTATQNAASLRRKLSNLDRATVVAAVTAAAADEAGGDGRQEAEGAEGAVAVMDVDGDEVRHL